MAPLRFLALGDSYTIGEGLPAADRWPVQLADRLRDRGIGLSPPRIIARTGWSTEDLSAALDRALLASRYDLVSISIGVNDQYRGKPVAGYRDRLVALLERGVDLAGGNPERVLVASIPDWSATPIGRADDRGVAHIAARLSEFNEAMQEAALARGVVYADITPSTREMDTHPDLVARDGLHPSAALYARWVDQIENIVRRMLTATSDP